MHIGCTLQLSLSRFSGFFESIQLSFSNCFIERWSFLLRHRLSATAETHVVSSHIQHEMRKFMKLVCTEADNCKHIIIGNPGCLACFFSSMFPCMFFVDEDSRYIFTLNIGNKPEILTNTVC